MSNPYVEAFSWALDLLDRYDEYLATIDGPEKVYSASHVAAKERARRALLALEMQQAEISRPVDPNETVRLVYEPPSRCPLISVGIEPPAEGSDEDESRWCPDCEEYQRVDLNDECRECGAHT